MINERTSFKENVLLPHRGLSGPAVLQISSYWKAGESVTINLLPEFGVHEYLNTQRDKQAATTPKNALSAHLPKRFISTYLASEDVEQPLQNFSQRRLKDVADKLNAWDFKPNSTEGYRTAEVTLGGVDCDELSSQTMQSNLCDGLYFIGEVVDVTGWLGGYNFQWS